VAESVILGRRQQTALRESRRGAGHSRGMEAGTQGKPGAELGRPYSAAHVGRRRRV